MAFSNNIRPNQSPGAISGNPLNGLCDRVCLQVKKVFDACLNQTPITNYTLTLTNVTPANPTAPLTFVSGRSSSSKGTITSYKATKIPDRQNSRVEATISIPVEAIFVDANNIDYYGYGEVVVEEDVILNVPSNSVIPTELAATVSAVIADGTYVSDTTFSCTICATIVLKIEAEVEMLMPSYGYCFIPPCVPYTEDVCAGVFDLPLFPKNNG